MAGSSSSGLVGRVAGWFRQPPPPGSVAGIAERLAVLLEAGVPPAAAWRHLQDALPVGADAAIAGALAAELLAGRPGAGAVLAVVGGEGGGAAGPSVLGSAGTTGGAPAAEWRQLAAAWSVAESSGTPLAACLRSVADAMRALTQARRDAEVALSGPRTTSRLVLGLPLLGILLGLALGLDTPTVLFTRPVGWFCLATGAALVVAARAWNRRLVARASPSSSVPGLEFELLAMALGGGGGWAAARRTVSRSLADCCPELGPPAAHVEAEVDGIVRLSERAGVPGAGLLRAAADEHRREARASAAAAAERLGVWLMLPLGACILPAFLLVGIVPLFVALLSSTGFGG